MSYLERWRKKSRNVLFKLGNACRVGNLLEQWKGAWRWGRIPFVVVPSLSHVWLFVTPTDCSTRTSSLLHYLLELALIHVSQWWCHPPISSSTTPFSFYFQSFPASGSFPVCWLLRQVAKVWSFSFSNNSSTEYSGLISFWNDWFDLLAVQETLKSLLQHHSLKSSILWSSALFMDQLSHPYMTTGRTIVLIIWTLVRKVVSLFFNVLCFSVAFFKGAGH